MNIEIKDLYLGTVMHFSRFIVTSICAVLIHMFLTRALSAIEYGTYGIIISTLSIGATLISPALAHILTRYVPEFYKTHQYVLLKRFIGLVIFFYIILALLVGEILILGQHYFIKYMQVDLLKDQMPYLALAFIFYVITHPFVSILHGFMAHIYRNISEMMFYILKLSLLYIFISKFFINDKIYAIFLSLIVSYILVDTVYLINIIKKIKNLDMKKNVEKVFNIISVVKYGLFNYLNGLGNYIFDIGIDIYMISILLGVAQAGLYSFAASISQMVAFMNPVVSADKVFFPFLIKKYVADSDKDHKTKNLIKLIYFYYKVIFFFGLPLIFIMTLLSPNIITVFFDSKFLPADNLLKMGVIFFVLYYCLYQPQLCVIQIIEKTHILLISKFLLIYNITMNIILLKLIGTAGAMISTGTSLMLVILCNFLLLKKYIKIEIPYKTIFKICINCILSVLVIMLFRSYALSYFLLIILGILSFLLYLFMCYINNIFSKAEQDLLNTIFKIKIFKF